MNVIDVSDQTEQIDSQDSIYYGNLRPTWWKDGRPRIYLGPQPIIFTGNFLFSLIIIITLQYLTECPLWQRILGFVLHFCFLWNLLDIGLSSPGLAAEYSHESNISHSYCSICRTQQSRGTRHCKVCDVCVADHDHHCIFLGKCIGRNNMSQFKAVLICVFVNLVYFGVINFINNPHF